MIAVLGEERGWTRWHHPCLICTNDKRNFGLRGKQSEGLKGLIKKSTRILSLLRHQLNIHSPPLTRRERQRPISHSSFDATKISSCVHLYFSSLFIETGDCSAHTHKYRDKLCHKRNYTQRGKNEKQTNKQTRKISRVFFAIFCIRRRWRKWMSQVSRLAALRLIVDRLKEGIERERLDDGDPCTREESATSSTD